MNRHDLWLRLRTLVAPRTVERELREELDFHLAREVHEQRAAGVELSEARARATARFGSVVVAAEGCRDARGVAFVTTCARDIRYALRGFRRTPVVSLTIVGTLALALGLCAAVFTIFSHFVLRPDAVTDPTTLAAVVWRSSSNRSGRTEFNFRQYDALRREAGVFSDVAARLLDIETRIDGRLAGLHLVTGNYFQVLGVSPALGRAFSPADAPRPGAEPVIVLSHRGWQRLFQQDPDIVSRRVLINGSPSVVIGVMPDGFVGLDSFGPDYWAPLTMVAEYRPHMPADNPHSLEVIGRLKPGMSFGAARAALTIWASRTADGRPANHQPEDLILQSRRTSTPLSLGVLLGFSPLFVAFGLVLVIACANIANLLLARAFVRQREIGVRLSLGASRGRIVRQLLTESLLLALAAAAFALLISRVVIEATVQAVVTTMPQDLAEYFQPVPPSADFRVVVFVALAAVAATAVFGLVPALRASRPSLLRAMSTETGGEVRPARARGLLVIAQVTASALLLITAGIFLRAAVRSADVDPGLRVSDTVVIEFEDRLRPALLDAVMAEPSVASVAAAWPGAPLLGRAREALGSAVNGAGNIPADYRLVSPKYFEVFDIPIVAGRGFSADEASSRAAVAVVSQQTARELWPNGNAVGQFLRLAPTGMTRYDNDAALASQTFLIVGVARDVAGYRFGYSEAGVFLPAPVTSAGAALVVRANGDVHAARRALLSRLTAIDPNLRQIMMMGTLGALLTYPLQVGFWTTVVLGAIALTLTVSGIFGVLSYLVVQRTKEIGVRLALGATAGRVVGLVLWQSLRTVGVGLALGTALASGLAALFKALPVAATMNPIVHVFDPVAYAGALLSILAACVAAALVPSLRAARIDPIATLRHD